MQEEFPELKMCTEIVRAIVEYQEAATVERSKDDMGILIKIKVAASDMGRLIGKEGNTAKAIRTLLRIVGMKYNARVSLLIEEPDGVSHDENADLPESDEAIIA